jgi:hypothetical protein
MCFAGEAAFLRPTQYASSSHTFGFRAMEMRNQFEMCIWLWSYTNCGHERIARAFGS